MCHKRNSPIGCRIRTVSRELILTLLLLLTPSLARGAHCPAGQYANNVGLCLSCPANSTSAEGSSGMGSCYCNSGYQGKYVMPVGNECNASKGSCVTTMLPNGAAGAQVCLGPTWSWYQSGCMQNNVPLPIGTVPAGYPYAGYKAGMYVQSGFLVGLVPVPQDTTDSIVCIWPSTSCGSGNPEGTLTCTAIPLPPAPSLTDLLKDKLAKYCIPKDGQGCTDLQKAAYDSGASGSNKCGCSCVDMAYNTTTRSCDACEFGSAGKYATSCNVASCPAGTALVDISSGCPSGMASVAAQEWSCDSPSGPVSCPAGTSRFTY
jgi:hypothetical protein